MYFTKEDYNKIREYIAKSGIKDSEFKSVITLHGEELIPILQKGENKIVILPKLVNYLKNNLDIDFLNISADSAYDALEEAITNVPTLKRKLGLVITVLLNNVWLIWQFTGSSIQNWYSLNYWTKLTDANLIKDITTIQNNVAGIKTNITTLEGDITALETVSENHNKLISNIQNKLSLCRIEVPLDLFTYSEKVKISISTTVYNNLKDATILPVTIYDEAGHSSLLEEHTTMGNYILIVYTVDNKKYTVKVSPTIAEIINIENRQKGAVDGIASLDDSGKVPAEQLPSYVDDVIEVLDNGELPWPGEKGKIYVILEDNSLWRWSGSDYIEISNPLKIGETVNTAYDGAKGKALEKKIEDHINDDRNPHRVDKSDVGLGNVDNTSDANKPISTAANTKFNTIEQNIADLSNTLDSVKDELDDYYAFKNTVVTINTSTDYGVVGDKDIALLHDEGNAEYKDIYPVTHTKAVYCDTEETTTLETKLNSISSSIEDAQRTLNTITEEFGVLSINSPNVVHFTDVDSIKTISFSPVPINSQQDMFTEEFVLQIQGKTISNGINMDFNISGMPTGNCTTVNLMPYFLDIPDDTIYVTIKYKAKDIETGHYIGYLDEKTVVFKRDPIPMLATSYIIDQRKGGAATTYSECFYEYDYEDSNGKTIHVRENCGKGIDGDPTINTISWLHKNSHAYVGTYNVANEVMNLKLLDDTTRLKYVDGSDSSEDISNPKNDVWIKFPCDVYFKSEKTYDIDNVESGVEPELDDDIIKITISIIPPEDGDNSWLKWDGNTLIAVYRCTKTEDGSWHSISTGTTPSEDMAIHLLDAFPKNNLDILNYDSVRFLQILLWGFYGYNRCSWADSPLKCGYSDASGMKDNGKYIEEVEEGASRMSSFWGLEDYINAGAEFIPDIYFAPLENVSYSIVNPDKDGGNLGYFANTTISGSYGLFEDKSQIALMISNNLPALMLKTDKKRNKYDVLSIFEAADYKEVYVDKMILYPDCHILPKEVSLTTNRYPTYFIYEDSEKIQTSNLYVGVWKGIGFYAGGAASFLALYLLDDEFSKSSLRTIYTGSIKIIPS